MKIHQVQQGSDEWLHLRCGIPTASNLSKIITSKGTASTQKGKYMMTLLAEWCVKGPVDEWQGNRWTERGTKLEGEAADWYEVEKDVDVETVGFITRDDGLVGASPDRLIGEDGLLEIKCPSAPVHLGYLMNGLKVPADYFVQVQGELYVAEREWCDFLSYYPGMPPLLVRAARDEAFLERLQMILGGFLSEMLAKRKAIISMGLKGG